MTVSTQAIILVLLLVDKKLFHLTLSPVVDKDFFHLTLSPATKSGVQALIHALYHDILPMRASSGFGQWFCKR